MRSQTSWLKLEEIKKQPEIPLYPKEIKRIIKNKQSQMWSDIHPKYSKDDGFYNLSRQGQLIIFRLRTGHNRLKQHMFKKLKVGQDETCPCGMAPKNSEHVLQDCSLYSQTRSKLWSLHTPLKEKLYRSTADLETTVQYIHEVGLIV